LKAKPGLDLLANVLGYGVLTFLAGWTVSGQPLAPALLFLSLFYFLLTSAGYPLSQIPDVRKDRRRKDKGFFLMLGEDKTLLYTQSLGILSLLVLVSGVLLGYLKPWSLIALLPLALTLALVLLWNKGGICGNTIRYLAYVLGPGLTDTLLILAFLFG
jgi:4-hydroxybenzoate polyprenyltransferase